MQRSSRSLAASSALGAHMLGRTMSLMYCSAAESWQAL